LASRVPREGFAGILELECSPLAVCEQVAAELTGKMHATFGGAPAILLHGDKAQTFTYVPSHLRFVVGELLHNASKATVRHHLQSADGRLSNLPPIRVIVAVSDEAVTVKVADQAGGISRSRLADVWSYRSIASSHWKSGAGLGLPLARLYAKYFGGTLHLAPMEGYGTDGYVTLNKLADDNSENLLRVEEPPPAAAYGEAPSALPAAARQREGRWGAAIRLFDAQGRRRSSE